jgi:hypothetical protein
VGSFFLFPRGGASGIRAGGADISLIDVMLSDLGRLRSLGSFGCGVFLRGALGERTLFFGLVVSEMASRHQEEHHTRRNRRVAKPEGKRLNWMDDLVAWER